jgi:DNA-binding NtrC family response regulator
VISEVKRWRPKAIIIDLFIPRLGGPGALARIRRLAPEIVPILISGTTRMFELVAEAGASVAGTFTKPLDLPAMLAALRQAGVIPPKNPAATALEDLSSTITAARRARVLVVDDEAPVREVVVEYLRRRGFEALGAGDGHEALRRIPEFRPQIVLLDIAMPRLGGVETLRQIRARHGEICVVMISGVDDVETARQTLTMGAADYLTKPMDYRYLDTVLAIHVLMGTFESEAGRMPGVMELAGD